MPLEMGDHLASFNVPHYTREERDGIGERGRRERKREREREEKKRERKKTL